MKYLLAFLFALSFPVMAEQESSDKLLDRAETAVFTTADPAAAKQALDLLRSRKLSKNQQQQLNEISAGFRALQAATAKLSKEREELEAVQQYGSSNKIDLSRYEREFDAAVNDLHSKLEQGKRQGMTREEQLRALEAEKKALDDKIKELTAAQAAAQKAHEDALAKARADLEKQLGDLKTAHAAELTGERTKNTSAALEANAQREKDLAVKNADLIQRDNEIKTLRVESDELTKKIGSLEAANRGLRLDNDALRLKLKETWERVTTKLKVQQQESGLTVVTAKEEVNPAVTKIIEQGAPAPSTPAEKTGEK